MNQYVIAMKMFRIPLRVTQAVLIAVLFLMPESAESIILKKIDRDGNITYYNRPGAKRAKKLPPTKFDGLINKYAHHSSIDPYLVKCLIKVESDFNPDAVSVAGAMGLMQLMQDTARMYDIADPLDPEENIMAGTRHLKMLLKYFKNNIPLSLAAYHAGLGRVKRHNAIPPIRSTVKYVNRIMYYYRGTNNYKNTVRRLYKRIDRHGDIIYSNRKNTNILDK